MIGRLCTLSGRTVLGSLKAENGEKIHFDSAAVQADDVACLAIGQLVSYELMSGQRAVNVRLYRETPLPEQRAKAPEQLRPRYLGFEQAGSLRVYRFERAVPREEKRTFVVTADLDLFLRHHVGVQEGPALCLHVFTMMQPGAPESAEPPLWSHALTDSDMLAYMFSRNVASGKKHGGKIRQSAKTSLA